MPTPTASETPVSTCKDADAWRLEFTMMTVLAWLCPSPGTHRGIRYDSAGLKAVNFGTGRKYSEVRARA